MSKKMVDLKKLNEVDEPISNMKKIQVWSASLIFRGLALGMLGFLCGCGDGTKQVKTISRIVNRVRKDFSRDDVSIEVFVTDFCKLLSKVPVEVKFDTSDNIRAFGKQMREIASDMLSLISRSNIPDDVRDAALELTTAYNSLANVLSSVPYIPQSNGEALVLGLGGHYDDIEKWNRRVDSAINSYNDKRQKFLATLVRHGFKLK